MEGSAYIAEMVPELLAGPDGGQAFGRYFPDNEALKVRYDYYFALGDPGEALDSQWHGIADATTFVTVHELFHAIQYSHQGFRAAAYDGVTLGWISEGTANLIMLAYADKFEPELNTYLPVRDFDEPLHSPQANSDTYGTWFFWKFVGEEIGSADDVQYLASILSADLSENNGLAGVDSALSDYGGLYELLPEFFADPRLEMESFGTPEVFPVRLGSDETEVTEQSIYFNVKEVAGSQIDVVVEGSVDDPVDVEIRLLDDHADLHLLVEKERFDKLDGARRNVFRTQLEKLDAAKKFQVVVANVAREAATSQDRHFRLQVRVGPAEYARMTTAGSGAEIDLDRIVRTSLIPAGFAPGTGEATASTCSIRLLATSSVTGDGFELAMDHPGPISPGSYAIALQDEGLFDPPEDHPGEFVAQFRLGAGNPATQGIEQVYGGQSGRVELEKADSTVLRGTLSAAGRRAADGAWRGETWVEFPASLETTTIEAEFQVMPRLPAGTAGLLSLDACFGEANEQATNPEVPGDTPAGTAGDAASSAGEQPAGDQAEEAGSAPESNVRSVQCEPLEFGPVVRFLANPELPFTFDQPAGWKHARQGSALRGDIFPPGYRDGGISYDASWVRNERDLEMTRGLHEASWPEKSEIDYGGQAVAVHGGQLGDALHAYFILPVGNRHLKVELRFKGRRTCSMAPVEALRQVVLASLEPAA